MQLFKSVACLISATQALVISGPFADHSVIRFQIQTQDQLNLLKTTMRQQSLTAWNDHLAVGANADILVPPALKPVIARELAQIPSNVWISNVQTLLDAESEHTAKYASLERSLSSYPAIFNDYRSTDDYIAYLTGLAGATQFTIGNTYLGKPIRGVKFGTGPQTIVFTGGIHAREWIASSTATFIASYLLSDDAKAVSLRSRFTFHVIPVFNVDGYEFTRQSSSNRMFRKNRQPNAGSSCVGTDINRNFGFKWGDAGTDTCGDDYQGTAAFSTPEAKALQSYMKSLPGALSYFDFHSYAQLWLYPWGYVANLAAPDNADFVAASKLAVDALKSSRGTKFTAEKSADLYPATGCTDDNMYGTTSFKYSLTIELPDTGRYGFILPASEIIPVGEETLKGAIAFWEYASAHPTKLYKNK
ncbi:corticosteroid- binding protein [Kappamyces sp. JEL0680]|nr:corticosteroid- binding protein [Kappamyces sp. JEL0680]